ncbi:hypothetical protein NE237_006045 [Protea cynaroides]|uniref:Uncharacterized protein n=1 Tax=Protea cynaroides TaxID=273540 RepID=A0A9Q0KMD0_9MAGN|nr:hypothetical protein NE237_006045 [Protea cynaroides]
MLNSPRISSHQHLYLFCYNYSDQGLQLSNLHSHFLLNFCIEHNYRLDIDQKLFQPANRHLFARGCCRGEIGPISTSCREDHQWSDTVGGRVEENSVVGVVTAMALAKHPAGGADVGAIKEDDSAVTGMCVDAIPAFGTKSSYIAGKVCRSDGYL